MFGYIAPLLRINFPRNRLKGHIESYQNIIQTIDFILRRYFPPSARGMFCVQLNVLSQFSPSVQCMDEVYDILGCHPDHILNYCMHLHTFSDCFCCHEGRDRQLAYHILYVTIHMKWENHELLIVNACMQVSWMVFQFSCEDLINLINGLSPGYHLSSKFIHYMHNTSIYSEITNIYSQPHFENI